MHFPITMLLEVAVIWTLPVSVSLLGKDLVSTQKAVMHGSLENMETQVYLCGVELTLLVSP